MSSNKSQGFQLQRRPGRRRSNDSPTSPTFLRRHGRPSDSFSPPDSYSAITSADTPTVDLDVPSPLLDFPLTSPASIDAPHATSKSSEPFRTSEESNRTRHKYSGEMIRPSTGGTGLGLTGINVSRTIHTPEASYRNPSWTNVYRDTGESVSRTTSREAQDDGPGPAYRSFSSSAVFTERGMPDDAGQPKAQAAKKSRLNLLNPMSLLARRRSSQNSPRADENNMSINTLHVPAIPDNFDPSIRGNIVHDFSVPRTRRINNELSPRPGLSPASGYPRRPSETASPALSAGTGFALPSTHSPMFKEHFQDDRNVVQPANTSYLHNNSLQPPSSSSLPTFARRLPLSIPDQESQQIDEESSAKKPADAPDSQHPTEPDHPPPPPPQKKTPPPPAEQKIPSPVLDLPPVSMLPKHMTSTSSRFSFQIGGQGSLVQEKLLEARHKEHASKSLSKVTEPSGDQEDDDYDEYNYDMDDTEEEIPGMNAGYGDDGGFDNDDIEIKNINMPSSSVQENLPMLLIPSYEDDDGGFETGDIEIRNIDLPTSQTQADKPRQQESVPGYSLQGFHFTPQLASFSPTSPTYASEPTPRDAEGFPIGMAESMDTLNKHNLSQIANDSDPETIILEHLRINTDIEEDQKVIDQPRATHPFEDADLYFDDGEFDTEDADPGEKFDESLLDDDNHAIRDIPAENARRYQQVLWQSARNEGGDLKLDDANVQGGMANNGARGGTSTQKHVRISSASASGLTEDNLAAYHDALAMAANEAAANGKFERSISFGQSSDDDVDSPFHDSQPGVSSSGSRYSHNFQGSAVSDNDGFLYDDEMDDEAMIAAANAEALENDEDGFYGQEFGFYARAHTKEQANLINGGYFASRGSNGVKRSHSGKANFQEPSLTPITERSEWSTRNSVASLQIHGGIPGSAQSLPSPGMAQLLASDSPIVEDEMTLSALLKLRRGAFGGSSGSVNSLGDRHNAGSSPLAHMSGYSFPHTESLALRMSSPTSANMANSMSIAESEDEDDEDAERPTVTQNTPHKKNVSPVRRTSLDQPPSSPLARLGGHHSRTSSGAESVSYAREKDGRWVLERRRTGDGGELELVGREYLAGARI